ncbi:MAG: molybdopterin molybdotransferase MoeA [Terracidiphilus sp.]|jgi:molybdopterin molybdotransferase
MSNELPGYDEAAELVAAYCARLARLRPSSESVGLDLAAGRVLAQPLCADRDQPPFARSTRDGYACRAREAFIHKFLRLAGSSRAGDPPAGPLPKGAAWEIMTGASVPAGADAVMMIEHVEQAGDRLRLLPPRKIEEGENVVDQGAQARAGDELLPAGTVIHSAQIALAAACGYTALDVFARPRVAILTTGDELVPVALLPAAGQIRNSNAPMLAAMVEAAGGEHWVLPTAADSAEALDAALAQAADASLLLITGGVSAGKFDLVKPALARAGARFHFTGVRIQPGKPLVFGELPVRNARTVPEEYGTKCFFGLPGNPVSSAVTFLLFAAPVLAALAGRLECGPRFALARLASKTDKHGKAGLMRFLPAACTFGGAAGQLPEVALVPMQGSGDLAALARSNCFLVVPEDAQHFDAGAIVRILLP